MASDYRKSNYAINRVRKGIVYRNADGSILEVTFEKIAKDDPNFTEEDFEKLKQLSDELYHREAKDDWNYHHHVTSNLDDNRNSSWLASLSLEEEMMNRGNAKRSNGIINKAIDTLLTPTQRRRFIMLIFEGFTYREIAQMENVNIRAVWESVELSKKENSEIYKKFLKRHSTKCRLNHIR